MSSFVDDIFEAFGRRAPKYAEIRSLDERNRRRALDGMQLLDSEERRIHYEAILVDEVQDLWPEEVRLLMSLTERIMLAGDSHQKMHDASGGIATAIGAGCAEVELKHHYRISLQICRIADSILVHEGYRLNQFCHYRGPPASDPLALGGLSREKQIERLAEALDVQLDTYNDPTDLLGVVAWRTDDCDYIYEQLLEYDRFSENTRLFHSGIQGRRFDQGCKICVMTIQSCKGLEFRALHWMFADQHQSWTTRDRAYTVVTRAKSSLTLYHDEPLPAILAGAFPPPARGLFEDDEP
jgi:superfamily I DNA/RNA helicase